MTRNHVSFYNPHGSDGFAPMLADGAPTGWVLVGRDPHGLTYYEDDARAIDHTNWDAIVDALDEDDRCTAKPGDPLEHWTREDAGDWWMGVGYQDVRGPNGFTRAWFTLPMGCDDIHSQFDRVLLVRDGSDAADEVADLVAAIGEYCIIDDVAYNALEVEAWDKAWEDWAMPDTWSAMVDQITDALGIDVADDDQLCDMVDACEGWEAAAQSAMSHHAGLTGEYDHAGAVAGGLGYVAAVMRAWAAVVDVMVWDGRRRAGVFELPFADVVA